MSVTQQIEFGPNFWVCTFVRAHCSITYAHLSIFSPSSLSNNATDLLKGWNLRWCAAPSATPAHGESPTANCSSLVCATDALSGRRSGESGTSAAVGPVPNSMFMVFAFYNTQTELPGPQAHNIIMRPLRCFSGGESAFDMHVPRDVCPMSDITLIIWI